MGVSLESSRPIMAPSLASKRASARFSFYSTAPSIANTVQRSYTSDSAQQEVKDIVEGFEKLHDKNMEQQRFEPTPEKSDNLSKLALAAKVDRALGHRMCGQDAIMRKKTSRHAMISEKSEKGTATT